MARQLLPAAGNADACVARCGGRPGGTAREAEHAACFDRFRRRSAWNLEPARETRIEFGFFLLVE